MLSRISCTLRTKLKPSCSLSSGFNLASVERAPSNQTTRRDCGSCRFTFPVKIRRVHYSHSCTVFTRNFSTTSKERLELDPKLDDENTTEGVSEFSLDDSTIHNDYVLNISDKEMEELTNGDPELIKKVSYIQLEYSLCRQEGVVVPSKIPLQRWKELLALNSKNQRKRFYAFLFKNEMKKQKAIRKKKESQELRQLELGPKLPKETDKYGMTYGLGQNTIYHRIYETTINKHYHNRIFQEMKFGRPLVFDLSYDEHMNSREAKNCAKQIELTLTQNRLHPQPFNVILCNANRNLNVMQHLLKSIPTLFDNDYMIDITEKSYLDLYPKESIVYLSPNAKDFLEEFSEDEVYIIGAMVDKTDPRPLSMAKAKKEGLKLKKLPLDKYLDWGLGGKSLTLDQMNNILLDLRYTKDWDKAFSHVPRRKLRQVPDGDEEFNSDVSERMQKRRERQSKVYDDYALLNQKRGFQHSNRFSDKNQLITRRDINKPGVKIRSIMMDED